MTLKARKLVALVYVERFHHRSSPVCLAFVEKRFRSLDLRTERSVIYAWGSVLTSAEDQKLVAVEITEVRAVRAVLAARTWTPLIGATEL